MKKKKILLIVLIALVVCFLGYKIFCLSYFKVERFATGEFENFLNGLEVKDKLTIKTNNSSNDYLEFKEMKVRNDFKDFSTFEPTVENSLKLVLYNEDKSVKASFWMSVGYTYIELLKSEKEVFSNSHIINTGSLEKYLDSKNIKNDMDLFNYLYEHRNDKNNIFTSSKKIQDNYALYNLSYIMLPLINSITEIDGDYTGYILNMPEMKEVSILKNDKRYGFMFMGTNYFTDEKIQDLLNTLVIE